MFDQTYFHDGLKKQAEQVGGNPVVEITLVTGTRFFVRDVVETRPGIVMLNVYPHDRPAGVVAPSTSSYSAVPDAGYHPVAIAYEAVGHVVLSTSTADHYSRIGFKNAGPLSS